MEFEYTVEAAKDVSAAISDLEEALVARKFSTLWHLNVNETLEKKGLDLEPEFHIFEVCSAPRAKQALEFNIKAGYLLPCKIVVYRRNNQTYIGLLRPELMIDLLGDHRLKDLATEVEAILREAVDAAAR